MTHASRLARPPEWLHIGPDEMGALFRWRMRLLFRLCPPGESSRQAREGGFRALAGRTGSKTRARKSRGRIRWHDGPAARRRWTTVFPQRCPHRAGQGRRRSGSGASAALDPSQVLARRPLSMRGRPTPPAPWDFRYLRSPRRAAACAAAGVTDQASNSSRKRPGSSSSPAGGSPPPASSIARARSRFADCSLSTFSSTVPRVRRR